jgi:hypothetical protein
MVGDHARVEVMPQANWYSGVYAYCLFDDWDSYYAAYVAVDPAR